MHPQHTSFRLTNRADMQQCVRELFAPLKRCFSPGGARVRVGMTGAVFSIAAEELEGFARPLWGLAPLAAGGGEFDDWALIRQGLANGSDPRHPEYWGIALARDQLLVEMAPIAFSLLLAPEQVWQPLSADAQRKLGAWLDQVNKTPLFDCNWLFFKVLVNLGLAHVGAPHDTDASKAALDRLENFYLGDGWYFDGANGTRDYYNAFAFHFYGLIYAAHAAKTDPERASRFRERAAEFGSEFIYLFSSNGSAIPYGRSLIYRFAQGAFWGALAYANVEAMDWGVVKGLLFRHLRWWFKQPIFDRSGLLTVGYGYANGAMTEGYNSSSSPYWAMKAFLPLALPESHPFWQSEEKPLPKLKGTRVLKQPGFVIYRASGAQDHVVALTNGENEGLARGFRHAAEKYAKFAYSTRFAFSVPNSQVASDTEAHDSMLALSEDGLYFRVRRETVATAIDGNVLYSRWHPWPDVEIETWLAPASPWHVRLHRIRTTRSLSTIEGGFSIDRAADDGPVLHGKREEGLGFSLVSSTAGACGLRDLEGKRRGYICLAEPNTNLQYPRSLIPSLRGKYEPGEHLLICAVLALAAASDVQTAWDHPPYLQQRFGPPVILDGASNETVLSIDSLSRNDAIGLTV